MTKKVAIEKSEAKLYPQTQALLQSEQYDDMLFTDMVVLDEQDLKSKCSLLATTANAEYFIGSTFAASSLAPGQLVDLEISVVKEAKTFAGEGKHRVSLSSIAGQYAVLQSYVTAGLCAQKFMQNKITWAEYKRALTELVAGDIV